MRIPRGAVVACALVVLALVAAGTPVFAQKLRGITVSSHVYGRDWASDAIVPTFATLMRSVFPGHLTYAANWTDYQQVPFWDALDAIGVQAYFPIADRADAAEAALRESWAHIMGELRGFAERHDRYVVFTELGYNRSLAAPVRPWDARTDGEEAAAIQQTCMRIALEAIEHEHRVVGAFLWKWFPEPFPEGRDFQLASRGMRRVIAEVWGRYGLGEAAR